MKESGTGTGTGKRGPLPPASASLCYPARRHPGSRLEAIMSARALPLLLVFFLAAPARAQTLAVVEDADWPVLRAHCQELVKNLKALDAPLPAATLEALEPLLKQQKPDDPAGACRAVQKLLDAHCLLGVTVNPESRVKAARGPRKAELQHDKSAFVLVKVHNDGGVTHALSADSPQKLAPKAKQKDGERWLELAVLNDKPFANRLSGDKIEYRVMKLTPRQAGKREATLAFDVGQGSQDLGFRAEVPLLFVVKKR
jgi:hypothetical protein